MGLFPLVGRPTMVVFCSEFSSQNARKIQVKDEDKKLPRWVFEMVCVWVLFWYIDLTVDRQCYLGGGFISFNVRPCFGKMSNLTNTFQTG